MNTNTHTDLYQSLISLISRQIERYPFIQIQDLVKLLYQRTFGGEHLVIDERRCFSYLLDEKKKIGTSLSSPSYEDIGNGLCRLNLLPLSNRDESLSTLTKLFIKSSQLFTSSPEAENNYIQTLCLLEKLLVDKKIQFHNSDSNNDTEQSLSFLREYLAEKPHPIHHSPLYRNTYQPSYRIVLKDFVVYFSLFEAIDLLFTTKTHITLAIDGKCGSGKSTLASILSKVYDTNIISMDDFFLPPDLRTPRRLEEPGGNVHYERFEEEVLPTLLELKTGKLLSTPRIYRVFDCHQMDYSTTKEIENKSLTIVEGSYSMEPMFQSAYDLTIFLDISDSTQKERLLTRNGEEVFTMFETRWIPMENLYFTTYDISNLCQFKFYTK